VFSASSSSYEEHMPIGWFNAGSDKNAIQEKCGTRKNAGLVNAGMENVAQTACDPTYWPRQRVECVWCTCRCNSDRCALLFGCRWRVALFLGVADVRATIQACNFSLSSCIVQFVHSVCLMPNYYWPTAFRAVRIPAFSSTAFPCLIFSAFPNAVSKLPLRVQNCHC